MAFRSKANNTLIRRPAIFVYNYFKRLALDYRNALIESGKSMLERPVKTVFYSANIYILYYAYQTMPSFNSYKNDLIKFEEQQILTSSLIRNKQVETYIDTIQQLLLREQIHFIDCFLFSLIVYRRQHRMNDNSYKFYENVCSYLHLKRNTRIIDIGMFNRWFILEKKLRQADIIFHDVKN